MYERALIFLFVVGVSVDIIVTTLALQLGLAFEFNPLANGLIESGNMSHVMVFKLATMAMLAVAYAAAKSYRSLSSTVFVLEKAIQISTIILWLTQIWNIFNITVEVIV